VIHGKIDSKKKVLVGKVKDLVTTPYQGDNPNIPELFNTRIYIGDPYYDWEGRRAGAYASSSEIVLRDKDRIREKTFAHELRHVLDSISLYIYKGNRQRKRDPENTWSSDLELDAIFTEVLHSIYEQLIFDQAYGNPRKETRSSNLIRTVDKAFNWFGDRITSLQSGDARDQALYKNYRRKAMTYAVHVYDNAQSYLEKNPVQINWNERQRPASGWTQGYVPINLNVRSLVRFYLWDQARKNPSLYNMSLGQLKQYIINSPDVGDYAKYGDGKTPKEDIIKLMNYNHKNATLLNRYAGEYYVDDENDSEEDQEFYSDMDPYEIQLADGTRMIVPSTIISYTNPNYNYEYDERGRRRYENT
jgi:hypothetical protein